MSIGIEYQSIRAILNRFCLTRALCRVALGSGRSLGFSSMQELSTRNISKDDGIFVYTLPFFENGTYFVRVRPTFPGNSSFTSRVGTPLLTTLRGC